MKKLISRLGLALLLTLTLTSVSPLFTTDQAHAQTPNTTLNFQARILLASGALVPDGNYNLEFKLYDTVSTGGTAQGVCTGNCLWMETRTSGNVVRVVNGYVSVNLGSVTAFGSTIPWSQDLYVTMRVGGIGAPVWDTTEMVNATTGRMKLSAVPLALVANNVRSANRTSAASDNIVVQTGTTTTSGNSGNISLTSGNAATTSGNIALNVGSGGTSRGTITIGTGANAPSSIALGSATSGAITLQSASTIGMTGTTTITGLSSGSGTALTVNNSTSTGSIFVAQDNGTPVFTIADGGTVLAGNTATGTTGTSSGVGATNTTTITLAAAGGFANGDVILVDNTGGSGQDYYTRITAGGGTTTLTVDPAVSYGTAAGYTGNATITKYNIQNIGAASTGTSFADSSRFFQGYFLGGVRTGAGSTTLSDQNLTSSQALYLNTGGQNTRMTVTSGGDVGIGTSTPASKLEVSGTAANIGITVDAPTGFYAMQYFAENGTNKWHYEVAPTSFGGYFSFVESGVAERMRIATGGNIGIGTTGTPSQLLSVGGTTGNLTVSTTGALVSASTIRSNSGFNFNGTAGATTTCSGGNVLSNQVIQGGIVTGGTCSAAGSGTITGSGTATQLAYFSGASALASSANLFWDNTNGRLGIGTNSPSRTLTIKASNTQPLTLTTSDYAAGTTGSQFIVEFGASTGNTYTTLGALSAGGSTWNNIQLAPAGNVSINSSTFNNTLTVNGTLAVGGVAAQVGSETLQLQGSGAGVRMYDRATGSGNSWVTYVSSNIFRVFSNSAAVDRMTLDSSGTMNISSWLYAGGAVQSQYFLDSNNTSYAVDPSATSTLSVVNATQVGISQGLAVGTGAGISATHQARRSIQINTDTNYGGSNDNHSGALLVAGNMSGWTSAQFMVNISDNWGSYNTANPALRVGQGGVTAAGSITASSGTSAFGNTTFATGANYQLLICNPAGVGICGGIGHSGYYGGNLHIDSGQGSAATGTYVNWYSGTNGLRVGNGAQNYGVAYASAFTVSSSRRFKTNVVSSNYGLSQINALQPVKFDYINNSSAGRQLGLIAEDVLPIAPEVVQIGSDGLPEGIDYGKLSALLISGVQQLDVKVEANTTRLSVLESGEFSGSIHASLDADIDGDLTVLGNTTLTTLTVTGDTEVQKLTVNGKIITGGDTPSSTPDLAVGVDGMVSIDGNDTAGSITIVAGAYSPGQSQLPVGTIVNVSFSSPYSKRPKLLIDNSSDGAQGMKFAKTVTATGFTLRALEPLSAGTTYTLDYIAVE